MYYLVVILSRVTFDVEVYGVAVRLSQLVVGDTGYVTGHGTRHVLQYQTLIGHYYVGRRVVHQFYALYHESEQL